MHHRGKSLLRLLLFLRALVFFIANTFVMAMYIIAFGDGSKRKRLHSTCPAAFMQSNTLFGISNVLSAWTLYLPKRLLFLFYAVFFSYWPKQENVRYKDSGIYLICMVIAIKLSFTPFHVHS